MDKNAQRKMTSCIDVKSKNTTVGHQWEEEKEKEEEDDETEPPAGAIGAKESKGNELIDSADSRDQQHRKLSDLGVSTATPPTVDNSTQPTKKETKQSKKRTNNSQR